MKPQIPPFCLPAIEAEISKPSPEFAVARAFLRPRSGQACR